MAKPKKGMDDLKAELKATKRPKAKRTAKRRARAVEVIPTTVYQFRGMGTMLRKAIYVTPQEWEAVQAAHKASGVSASTIIRQAICNEFQLELRQ